MRGFAEVCEAVAATTKKNEKVNLVADYLRSLPLEEAAGAAVFFAGRPFPRAKQKILAVGSALVWQAVERLAGTSPQVMETTYRKHGDLGGMAEELLAGKTTGQGIGLRELESLFAELAERRGSSQKLTLLEQLLHRAHPLEAKYVIKIITGDLRIGLRENRVEEAIARAFDRPVAAGQRAHMLTGDISETVRLAAEDRLGEARLRLFHPVGFMLASPVESVEEALESLSGRALVEDKYDGVRAQAHKSGQTAKIFSRTLDEATEFPELLDPLARLPGEFVLDGEILAWRDDHPLPFTELQKRLGRKQPDLWLRDAVPVRFVVFDMLYADGELLLDTPLGERRGRLEALLAENTTAAIQLAAAKTCATTPELQEAFANALAGGNEGVMAKAPDSLYTPGRRGRAWLKLKQPMATLDVVVTAVEYGHGKRRGLLSDYTFAVRDAERLVDIGKAYSGLTDEEIRRFTDYFQQHTLADQGFRRRVEPRVVLEVAFNNIQRSRRHPSGYALRFPRIVRLRPDKPVEEIDTLQRVKELYQRQRGEGS